MSAQVRLERASSAHAGVLSNLLELYIHDLSAVFGLDVGADGRFGYGKLPLYWSEPERRLAFLIHADDSLAGFALVTRGSPASDDPDVFDVAEFFVLRRHRRARVGQAAAMRLWDELPGRWMVRVSEGNRGALPFWQRTIQDYTRGRCRVDARPGQPHGWRVYSFDVPAPRAVRSALDA